MKMNLKVSLPAREHTRHQIKSPRPIAASSENSEQYTCILHPDIVRHTPHQCPECGMTLIPMHQAIARAVIALRSLTAVTKALRYYQV